MSSWNECKSPGGGGGAPGPAAALQAAVTPSTTNSAPVKSKEVAFDQRAARRSTERRDGRQSEHEPRAPLPMPAKPRRAASHSGGSSSQNIKVAVRVRGGLPPEQSRALRVDGNALEVLGAGPSGGPMSFAFDYCYGSETTQTEVYEDIGGQILDHAFEGYNGTIFAYGQTGSGKSHSIMGSPGQLGIVPRLAVEMFDTGNEILVNELAMRPHNSGHWTIEGAVTSQFENHLRAVLDLPLGSPNVREPGAVMVNILGGDVGDLYSAYRHVFARDPGLKVHLYGKDVRPGRKVGHVTAVGSDPHSLLLRARHAADYFRGAINE